MIDYLGKYIAFVGGGDGSITTGYVSSVFNYVNKLEVRADDGERWEQEQEQEINMQEVVGVMHRTHPLINEEVAFKRIVGAIPRWWQLQQHGELPDRLYGTIDVAYVEAVLPEGSGAPTVFGVTVHSGDIGQQRLPMQIETPVFLPANRVEFIDATEELETPVFLPDDRVDFIEDAEE